MRTIEKYRYGSIRSFADLDFGPDIIMRLFYAITGISYKHEEKIDFFQEGNCANVMIDLISTCCENSDSTIGAKMPDIVISTSGRNLHVLQ